MNYLLDTSTLLWFLSGDKRLSARASAIIEHPDSSIFLSLASIWELAIKANLARNLLLPRPFPEFIDEILHEERVQLLHINVAHLKRVATLPQLHRDPFDRLIIAQSQVENLPVITSDAAFDSYGVHRLW